MQFLRGERVNINLHVGWWLRIGHTTLEYVSSGVVQTMVLQHYIFFSIKVLKNMVMVCMVLQHYFFLSIKVLKNMIMEC